MFGAALFFCVFQMVNQGGPPAAVNRRSEAIGQQRRPEWTDEETTSVAADDSRQAAEYQQHEFVSRFNSLMKALTDFASTYNAGVVNAKKAKAVRKALHELEKSDWFRSVKGD